MRANVRLGKQPKRVDPRTLQLRKYLRQGAAPSAPPTQQDWITGVPQWPMFLNDTLGDCVIAGAGHEINLATFRASGIEASLTDADILAGYEAVGGYDPSDPSTDQGCDMLTALKYWRQTGFGGHKIAAFAEVNVQDAIEVQQAIALFGSLYIGLALPVTAQGAAQWTVPPGGTTGDGAPGSWGGHCVVNGAYRPGFQTCITWGAPLDMTEDFFATYCDECYALISQDWIAGNSKSPSGLDLAQLQADLASKQPDD